MCVCVYVHRVHQNRSPLPMAGTRFMAQVSALVWFLFRFTTINFPRTVISASRIMLPAVCRLSKPRQTIHTRRDHRHGQSCNMLHFVRASKIESWLVWFVCFIGVFEPYGVLKKSLGM